MTQQNQTVLNASDQPEIPSHGCTTLQSCFGLGPQTVDWYPLGPLHDLPTDIPEDAIIVAISYRSDTSTGQVNEVALSTLDTRDLLRQDFSNKIIKILHWAIAPLASRQSSPFHFGTTVELANWDVLRTRLVLELSEICRKARSKPTSRSRKFVFAGHNIASAWQTLQSLGALTSMLNRFDYALDTTLLAEESLPNFPRGDDKSLCALSECLGRPILADLFNNAGNSAEIKMRVLLLLACHSRSHSAAARTFFHTSMITRLASVALDKLPLATPPSEDGATVVQEVIRREDEALAKLASKHPWVSKRLRPVAADWMSPTPERTALKFYDEPRDKEEPVVEAEEVPEELEEGEVEEGEVEEGELEDGELENGELEDGKLEEGEVEEEGEEERSRKGGRGRNNPSRPLRARERNRAGQHQRQRMMREDLGGIGLN